MDLPISLMTLVLFDDNFSLNKYFLRGVVQSSTALSCTTVIILLYYSILGFSSTVIHTLGENSVKYLMASLERRST